MSGVLYLNIVAAIKQEIIKGIYKPGDMLESETTLIKRFDTTKMTIRKSLSLLSNEGYIYSVPGKGYFVRSPEFNNYNIFINKFDKLNVQIDHVKLISVSALNPSPYIYIKLNIPETTMIIEVKRALYSRNKIIAYEKIYSAYEPQSPIVEKIINFANYYEPIERENAFVIGKKLHINAMLPDDDQKKMLDISETTVIYSLEETMFNVDTNLIITYSEFFISTKYLTLNASMSVEKENIGIY